MTVQSYKLQWQGGICESPGRVYSPNLTTAAKASLVLLNGLRVYSVTRRLFGTVVNPIGFCVIQLTGKRSLETNKTARFWADFEDQVCRTPRSSKVLVNRFSNSA
jgi:hypothetical protein